MSSIPDQYARYLAEVAAGDPAPDLGKPISVADAAVQAMREARVMIEEQRATITELLAALVAAERFIARAMEGAEGTDKFLDLMHAQVRAAIAKARAQS